MSVKLIDITIDEFIGDLSQDLPTPGGGAATALVSSLGVSLGMMAANFTKGKKKYIEYENDIASCLEKLDDMKERFKELIDLDAVAFMPLAKAYSLPNKTEEDKKYRNDMIQEGLKMAVSVPLEVFELAVDSVEILEELSEKASKLLVSDVGVGINMIDAALKSSIINIEVNLNGMNDEEFKNECRRKIKEEMLAAEIKIEKINKTVMARING